MVSNATSISIIHIFAIEKDVLKENVSLTNLYPNLSKNEIEKNIGNMTLEGFTTHSFCNLILWYS